jgi:hypothetical protein
MVLSFRKNQKEFADCLCHCRLKYRALPLRESQTAACFKPNFSASSAAFFEVSSSKGCNLVFNRVSPASLL